MKRMALAAVALVATSAAVGACGGDSDEKAGPGQGAGPLTVVLKDIAFKPGTISVKAGDTVSWRFEDKGIAHNVVADDESFKSDTKESGVFQHTFGGAGTFKYSCTVHPGMNGTVTVS